ncbi:porin family protein [Adhaeribacter radiodurans]|uniref:PorT family protein n=1 Tax=Adhaeribacter radiodurans TaxID=2745197 RepID=A0A7L7L3Q4_9BACT|nr:porin family protein [Adhaeribacter radiodurans]QMU27215.1 PorT family protein [Adhaeribacter radiodurans]
MKKLVLFLVLLVSAQFAAQAQFTLGIKGGLSSSGVDVKNAKNTITQLKDSDNITGYHLGAFTRIKVSNVFLQPEVYFATSGGKLQQTDIQNNTIDEVKAKFTRLDVPLLVGYNFFKIARVQAGPVASVLVGSKIDGQKVKDYLNKTDWGFQVGAGFDISNLAFDVRYENVKRDYTNQNTSFDLKNKQIIVSVGIKLFGK